MNKGQEMFYNFLISHTAPENVEIVKEMLQNSFAAQDEGTFDLEKFNAFNEKLFPLLKTESVSIVKEATEHFKNTIK